MQQVGTVAAQIAEKIFDKLPSIPLINFSNFSVRKKRRLKNIATFFALFVFPSAMFFTGYNYIEGKGGVLKAVTSFGDITLKQVNLTVMQSNKQAYQSAWRVDPNLIRSALSDKVGHSLIDIDPEEIRKKINDISWVKSSSVKMILPDTLSITINEQTPVAVWQYDETFYLIDEAGNRITSENLDRYDYLPWVVGHGANSRIYEYVALMNDYADIFKHVKSAIRVGDRRWTLVTNSGIEIDLSENNPRASLEQLIRLHAQRGILNQDVASIDLRIVGKTFVRQKDDNGLSVYNGGQNT